MVHLFVFLSLNKWRSSRRYYYLTRSLYKTFVLFKDSKNQKNGPQLNTYNQE